MTDIVTVNRARCCISGVKTQRDPEIDTSGYHNGSERQRVRTNGTDYNSGHARMAHGGACSHRVRRRARWCRYDETVALHGRHQIVIQVQVQVGEIGARAAVDHHFIQRQPFGVLRRRVGVQGVLVDVQIGAVVLIGRAQLQSACQTVS